MTKHLTALTEAQYVYLNRGAMDRQAIYDAAVSLAEWGVFSATSIAKITGISTSTVLRLAPKSEKTGGKFNPDSIPHLVELIHLRRKGEMNVFEAQAALEGTSVYLAAVLTGIPRSTLLRWAKVADEVVAT